MSQDNKDFTLEDILAEQRAQREIEAAQRAAQQDLRQRPAAAQPARRPAPQGQPAQRPPQPRQQAPQPVAQEAAPQPAPRPQPAPQVQQPQRAPQPQPPQQEEAQADLNEYATGTVELPQEESQPAKPGKKEKKKKRWGLFGRKKRVPDFDENEDDIYYGIQLKPIDEYRMGYDPSGELTSEEETYKALFDDSKKAIDSEVEENFQRLQRERRRRVAEAVQTAGVDEQQVADEFGVVAPMPVTSFAADPYARQHGIAVEGGKRLQEDMTGIQKAMLETSADQTMEIKLNVLNDTVELQRVGDMAPVSEEAIGRVLDSPAPLEPDEQPAPLPQEPVPQEPVEEIPPEDVSVEELPAPPEVEVRETVVYNEPASQVREVSPAPEAAAEPVQEAAPAQPIQEMAEEQPVQEATPAAQAAPESQPVFEDVSSQTPAAPAPAEQPAQPEVTQEATQVLEPPVAQQPAQPPVEEKTTVINRPVAEPPQVASVFEYRPRSVPTHIIHAEVLQSAREGPAEKRPQAPGAQQEAGDAPAGRGPCARRGHRRVHRRLHRPRGRQVHLPRAARRDAGAHFAHDDYRRVHRAAGAGEPDFRRPDYRPRGPGLPAGGVRGAHLGVFGRGGGRVLPHRAQRPEGPVLL